MERKPQVEEKDSVDDPDFSLEHHNVAEIPPPRPKDPRSKAKYNIFSRLLFFWVESLFCHGCRHDLKFSDLYVHPSEADSEKVHKSFNRYWQQELERKKRGRKPRLWITILKCYWWRFIIHSILVFAEVGLNLGQSLIVGYLARYFSLPCDRRDDVETRNAYLYAASLVILGLIVAVSHAHGFLVGQATGMMSRIMMTAAIYKKVLSLSQVTIGRISIGHIVNLASNDVQRFELAFIFVPYLFIAPVHLIVTTYLVYREVGWVSFLLAVFVLLQLPLNYASAKLFAKTRLKSAKLTDKRVRIMNEVITGIRVIKMYAWEYAFKKIVTAIRKHESKLIRYGGVLRSLTTAFTFGGSITLMMGVVFLTFVGSGGELTTQRVFTILSLMNFLRRSAVTFIIRCLFLLHECSVAIKRLQKFLLLEEVSLSIDSSPASNSQLVAFSSEVGSEGYFRPESPWLPGTRKVNLEADPVELTSYVSRPCGGDSEAYIKVKQMSASWSSEDDKKVLDGITFELDKTAPLLAVVGPVGAGKSTLLQCLLEELEALDGVIEKKGKLSYASQDPWVFSGTVRENVLFGLPYKKEWYDKVIKACSLDKDLEMFISGDLTLVGERGVTLSGGQKARVNLARAVYCDADIYLLDDPLSAVDAAVGKHLFEECIRGVLKEKLVILVTHQVHFALQTDKLLALKDGEIHMYGTHSELSERNIDTVQLLGLIESEKNKQDVFAYKDCIEEEYENDGKVVAGPYQRMKSVEDSKSPQRRRRIRLESEAGETTSMHSAPSLLSLDSEVETSGSHKDEMFHRPSMAPPAEEKAHGSISMKTYIRYFFAGGNYLALFVVLVFFILGEGGIVIADWWLSDWASCTPSSSMNTTGRMGRAIDPTICPLQNNRSEEVSQTCSLTKNTRLILYAAIIISSVLLNFIRGVLFYLVCINASRVLHNRMFRTILRTPILFFDTNPSGRILNRFSKDIGFLDDLLPQTFMEYLFLLLRFMAIIAVASAANPYVLIALPIIILVFIVLRWYFLKTSRDIKRLEAISRSPVYSHISTTLQGLPVIRTFKRQDIAQQHFHTFQNQHTQSWYLYLIITRWFGLRLDFVSTFVLIAVAFISIPLISLTDSGLNPALLGLGLTYTIHLAGMFQFCVRQSTEVENIMISTERVMAYSRLEPEASLETLPADQKPPENWPSKGELQFEDAAFRYSPELPLVLKNLSFSVRASEKVGIVGRTGAGKSSLLSVVYRLAEPYGQITIDGVDTKSIGLHDLRKKMSIIPQDPVLFSGTMRYNLDPFDEYSDAELWEVLEQVQLKPAVEEIEGQLSGEVSEGGSNFSVGQRQLVCLARALLRKNKILILDEATANVDPKTDEIIQRAIREEFSGCTVLTIAHRLNTIMDSDRILVMDNGQVKEYASPYRLLQNPSSLLSKMVEKTGPEASRKLHQMAMDARSRVNRKQSVL